MTTRSVSTPEGVEWTVRRRWIPHREGIGVRRRIEQRAARLAARRRRKRRWDADIPFDVPLDLEGLVVLIVGVVIFAVLLVVFVLFGWSIVLLGIDLIWFVLVFVLGLLGRVVLGRPWRVEAVGNGERRVWHVQGFLAAGRARDELARQFQHGRNPLPPSAPELPHSA